MPEGALGFPRFSNFGPLTRVTEEELRQQWRKCPEQERPQKICREIKFVSLNILQDQGFFAECDDLVAINSGNCASVANHVKNELEFVTVMETIGGDHVWINYDDKHYDAETPTGVDDPFDLPIFSRFTPEQILRFSRMEARGMDVKQPETVREMIRERDQDA